MNRNISENNTIIMPEMINVLIIPEIIDIGPKMDVKKLSIPKYLPYISRGTILCAEVNERIFIQILRKESDIT